MNLVPEAHTNLSTSAWHPSVVEINQPPEVEEDTLGSFWSEVALEVASWSNLTLKHQVESNRIRQIVSSVRGLDVVLLDACIQLLQSVVLAVLLHFQQCFPFFWLHILLFLQNLLYVLIDELVSSVTSTSLDVFNHWISEFVNMALKHAKSASTPRLSCHQSK